MRTPRPYQAETMSKSAALFDAGFRRQLMVMATGLGKTFTCWSIAGARGPSLFVANTDELVAQAAEDAEEMFGFYPEIEKADDWATIDGRVGLRNAHNRVMVSSVQTLTARWKGGRKRMHRFDPAGFKTVVLDEADLSVSSTWLQVNEWFGRSDETLILGPTATPKRLDGRSLKLAFDKCCCQYYIPDAIEDGWLVPVREVPITLSNVDWSRVRVTSGGDFNQDELADVMEQEEELWGVVQPTIEEAVGMEPGAIAAWLEDHDITSLPDYVQMRLDGRELKRTIVFGVRVPHAERMATLFNRIIPHSAAAVSAKTPKEERRQVWKRFRTNELSFVCNVGIATRGFNEPKVEIIVIARPTKSVSLFTQMVGRGTRPWPGIVDLVAYDDPDAAFVRRQAIEGSLKPCVTVLNCTGGVEHKLMSVVDVFAGNMTPPEVIAAAKKAAAGRGAFDPQAALDTARAEAERRKAIVPKVDYRRGAAIDPTKPGTIKGRKNRGPKERPTPKQLSYLGSLGYTGKAPVSKRQAAFFIAQMKSGQW